jgi:hypothetical protein
VGITLSAATSASNAAYSGQLVQPGQQVFAPAMRLQSTVQPTDALDVPVTRRQQLVATVGTAMTSLFPKNAMAANCKGTPEQCVYEGSYSDPFHPEGYRTVVVNGDGTATVTGIDYKDKPMWTITGYFKGSDLLIDFSVKGGPKDLLSRYEDGGMKFPDGNKWSKQ